MLEPYRKRAKGKLSSELNQRLGDFFKGGTPDISLSGAAIGAHAYGFSPPLPFIKLMGVERG
jgi:hypothetical protein